MMHNCLDVQAILVHILPELTKSSALWSTKKLFTAPYDEKQNKTPAAKSFDGLTSEIP